jgi:hypothetical protein
VVLDLEKCIRQQIGQIDITCCRPIQVNDQEREGLVQGTRELSAICKARQPDDWQGARLEKTGFEKGVGMAANPPRQHPHQHPRSQPPNPCCFHHPQSRQNGLFEIVKVPCPKAERWILGKNSVVQNHVLIVRIGQLGIAGHGSLLGNHIHK